MITRDFIPELCNNLLDNNYKLKNHILDNNYKMNDKLMIHNWNNHFKLSNESSIYRESYEPWKLCIVVCYNHASILVLYAFANSFK